jgi:broad specificity phosphatase PhoE
MARLFLIRHGEAAAAWGGADDDPGLSARGLEQAKTAAATLVGFGGLHLVASPMRRCRETAAAYEAAVGQTARIEPRVSEVTTPAGVGDRRAWLAENFPWRDGAGARTWASVDPALHAWRDATIAAVSALQADCAVFSHFIAINAIVGAAMGRGETIVCRPDYASITELAVDEGALRLVRLGATMQDGEVR